MPKVDVLSFECRDEQDTDGIGGVFGSQDETWLQIEDERGERIFGSGIYRGLDTGDKVHVDMDPVEAYSLDIRLYEDDGPYKDGSSSAAPGPEDDYLGGTWVSDETGEVPGEYTVTVQWSGGEYDLTYVIM